MKTAEGRELWIQTLTAAIAGEQYFRVHDAGDMFNPAYADSWYQICFRLPETKFWIPTRAYQQAAGPLPVFDPVLNILRKLALLPNVTVRPSALNFGDGAPVVAGLHAGSTAEFTGNGVYHCPAPVQDGDCGDCRQCWEGKHEPVSYSKH
jgi:hypothetical protein